MQKNSAKMSMGSERKQEGSSESDREDQRGRLARRVKGRQENRGLSKVLPYQGWRL